MSDHYQITKLLCVTTGSCLYHARRFADGNPVVLKRLDPDNLMPLQVARFRREYELLQTLDIPGVIRPVALIEEQSSPAMVLPDMAGMPLESILDQGRLPLPVALRLGCQLAKMLEGLHAAQLVHQDICPANFMAAPEQGLVFLLDLGMAAAGVQQALLPAGPAAENWAYRSPEQTGRMNRTVDYRSDFYSLGVILYRMLCGALPFQANDALEWMHCHIARAPRPLDAFAADIPPVVSGIVMKLLEKMAEDRYQSAHGLQHDLERCLEQWEAGGRIEPFALAAHDVSEHLQVPQKLYGREAELARLLAVFERMVTGAQPVLLLVKGYAGIGKSSLVQRLRKPCIGRGAYFIAGKFDPYQRDIPYVTIAHAFHELMQQILAEPEERIVAWKAQFQQALGMNAQLIVDLIPQLGLIIGPQPAVPELSPRQMRFRFQKVFRSFISFFATRAHPLVLFLDDVQWADAASLDLIASLMTHPETSCLMLIVAYRDNEVTPAHPLMATMEAMRKTLEPHEIHLGPLPDESLCQLVADTLHCEPRAALPLAELIQRKADGNPFFVNQFLHTLQRDGQIAFDGIAHAWRWDMQRIEVADVTDNVVELMAGQIDRLNTVVQDMLGLAACLGHQIDLEMLARAAECTASEVAERLEPAVRQGFLSRMAGHYRWPHDRIRQAAYSRISEEEHSRIHLRIGRLLLAATPADRLAADIFDIVSQLNLGAGLITDPAERQRLAELNLAAAARAKRSAAFAAASSHAAMGIALLPAGAWESDYALALQLHHAQIEADYSCGRPAQADDLLDQALAQARTDLDRARLLQVQMLSATAQGDDARAIQIGLQALRLLGVNLPAAPEEWTAAFGAALARVDALLAGTRIEDLLDRPQATEPVFIAAIDTLSMVRAAAHGISPRLWSLVVVTMVELSLTHGHTGASALGYGAFAGVLFMVRQDMESGYRFGKLARQLVEKFHCPELISRINLNTTVYVDMWFEPLRWSIARLAQGFEVESERGDLQIAGYNILMACMRKLVCGVRLDEVADDCARASTFARQTSNDLAIRALHSVERLVSILREQPCASSAPETLAIDAVLACLGDRMDDAIYYRNVIELKRFVLFGAWADALRLAEAMAAFTDTERQAQRPDAKVATSSKISYTNVEAQFYHALAAAGCHDTQDAAARQASLALIEATRDKMAAWSRNCPANFSYLHLLLCAELARIAGERTQALEHYEAAIAAAAEFGFTHIQALAAERAAHAFEAWGDLAQAATCLQRAAASYAAWGAVAKVKQLDAQAARLREPAADTDRSLAAGPERFDFQSLVKAFQAISGEIVLERLLDMLMRIVIENAGARKGNLILLAGDGPSLITEARVANQRIEVRLWRESGLPAALLPASILNYVCNSRERVLLEDVAETNPFSADPYLRREAPKSVLCLPILRQSRLIGLLYLENDLVSHAFTAARLAVLELLAAQAAISLENAQLFTALQQENSERRRAEAALRDREARIRRLVDSNIIGILFWHLESGISEANDAFLQMTGYTRDDLASGNLRWSALTPPEYQAADQRALSELQDSGVFTPYEKEYIRKDGSRLPILIGGAFFEGSQECGVAFVLDLTERKEAEAERQARQVAEAANEAKSAFLANMSHELRSPLNTILGFGQLMVRQPELPEQLRQDLDIVLSSGEHLRTLINQVLDLSKLEAGHVTLNETSFNLVQLLRKVEDMFALKARDKNVRLQVEATNGARVDGLYVRADEVKLCQVLINLLSNALKFTAQGRITLSVRCHIEGETCRLAFAVADTGVGITPEELGGLGQAFVQARAGRQAGEGTGLGLAISRNFVQLMGGELHIDSQVGRGTTVSFEIRAPVVGAGAAATPVATGRQRVAGLAPGEPAYRILVADDRSEARRLLVRLLAPIGFEVREAANGQEAVELWQSWRPQLIWMDMRMPVMNGVEATRRIKASARGRATPVIALTAGNFDEERQDILTAGCDDYLRKPFHESELFALMHKHLGVHFVYQEDAAHRAAAPDQAMMKKALALLPRSLRALLQQASIRLESDAVNQAIEAIRVQDASLAQNLSELAHNFQYDEILLLLQDADDKETSCPPR